MMLDVDAIDGGNDLVRVGAVGARFGRLDERCRLTGEIPQTHEARVLEL